MSNTKIKAGQFSGVIGNGTDGYFLMSSGDGNMTWAQASTGPSVTSVTYPGDDTAADPAGGQTVVLTGTNFGSSMTVSIGGTTAPSVAHNSSTQLTITTPAKAAGDYDIVVTNTVTGASGTFVNGISYNGVPTWTTAAGSLGTFASETTISTITLQATEPDGGTITFNITNGALPTGLSLTGANIDGTTTAESSTTLYSFTIEAIDDENQSTPRNFSITVNSAFLNTDNFAPVTYSGNGGTQSISLDFQADLIWTKNRNNANPHMLSDSIRGFTKSISSDRNDAESNYFGTNQKIQNVTSSGYEAYTPSAGYGELNGTGFNYVAWCFKAGGTAVSNTDGSITTNVSANPAAGFSIIEYQGAGGGGSTGTGLSSPVELMIVKRYTTIQEVYLFQGSGTGTWNSFQMNTTDASTSRSVTVTNSTIQIPAAGDFNSDSNSRYIAYCFHSVDGYQKVGSYTGTSAAGHFIETGFEPRFLMTKRYSAAGGGWNIFDSTRGTNKRLFPHTTAVEATDGTEIVTFNSNGFTFNTADSWNNSSLYSYIYLAIA